MFWCIEWRPLPNESFSDLIFTKARQIMNVRTIHNSPAWRKNCLYFSLRQENLSSTARGLFQLCIVFIKACLLGPGRPEYLFGLSYCFARANGQESWNLLMNSLGALASDEPMKWWQTSEAFFERNVLPCFGTSFYCFSRAPVDIAGVCSNLLSFLLILWL